MADKKMEIKLRAFQITQNLSTDLQENSIAEILGEKYNKTTVIDRMLKRSTSEADKEHDLILSTKRDSDFLFGIMLRVELDSTAHQIPHDLLEAKSFSLTDMSTDEKTNTIYKKHYYFCLNDTYLVTSLPSNTAIKGFQTYLNWFINSATHPYEITPLLKPAQGIKLSDIREVVFEDDSIISARSKSSKTTIDDTRNRLIDITIGKLKDIFVDTTDLTEEEIKSVVSARLLLILKKPRSMSEEDYQAKFGAILKPVADTDHLHYITKKNQRINSDEILAIKPVTIEKTEKDFLDEEQLRQEMIKYLQEI